MDLNQKNQDTNTIVMKSNITKNAQEQQNKVNRIVNAMFIDFNLLASQYPQLYPHLVILDFKTTINFKKQESLIVLTQAIMKCIFNVNFTCPYNNLCPRIPNRLNYLIWINKFVPISIHRVLDIGTGATVIYPLLGWAVFKWDFLATQLNQQSFKHGHQLVERNNLSSHIKIVKSMPNQDVFKMLQPINGNWNHIDVVICNPPFYDQLFTQNQFFHLFPIKQQQQQQDREPQIQKKYGGYSAPLGKMTNFQFSCQGGQYSFFFHMYKFSFNYITKQNINTSNPQPTNISIKCFTCLLGRHSSFIQILDFLNYEMNYGVLQYFKVGQIKQGQHIRFVVLWKPKIII